MAKKSMENLLLGSKHEYEKERERIIKMEGYDSFRKKQSKAFETMFR